MTYTERDVIELMCRAPACPEWFEPDLKACDDAEYVEFLRAQAEKNPAKVTLDALMERVNRQKLIQWPKAYARMVLESK